MTDIHRLLAILQTARVRLQTEKAAQSDLAQVLTSAGISFNREHRLDAGDIPDFFVDGRLVVEVKVRGAVKRATFRQLTRYAEHPTVKAIILVTNVAMALPPTINGKPAFVVSLGRAWL